MAWTPCPSLAGGVAVRPGLVDDRDGGRSRDVGGSQRAAGGERHRDRSEEVRETPRSRTWRRARPRPGYIPRLRSSVPRSRCRRNPARGETRRSDPCDRACTLEQPVVERVQGSPPEVGAAGVDEDEEDVLDLESPIDPRELARRAPEQARGAQKHERKRDLRCDEHPAEQQPPSARSPAMKLRRERTPRGGESRQESRDQDGREREGRGEGENPESGGVCPARSRRRVR